MSNTQQKADSIKSKEYINLLKAYFQTLKPIIGEKQLLYFILGINLGLKSKDLLSLQWYDILNNDYTIKDYIERNEYKMITIISMILIYNFCHIIGRNAIITSCNPVQGICA